MTDATSRPRAADITRTQHTILEQTTRDRIARLAARARDDLDGGGIPVAAADQILLAAGTVVRETAALAARTGGCSEDDAQIARTALELILECSDPLVILAASARLTAALVAMAARAETAAREQAA